MKKHPHYFLRLTEAQKRQIQKHIFPGDGKEAGVLCLCGWHEGVECSVLSIHEIVPIPYEVCTKRSADFMSWPVEWAIPLFERARLQRFSILKIHSHPGGLEAFSPVDDESDGKLFPSIHDWMEGGGPHMSAVMVPRGHILARAYDSEGCIQNVEKISVVGARIEIEGIEQAEEGEVQLRTRQAFGLKTTRLLGGIKAGIVGGSGTGSFVAEELLRLGVDEIVIVDPDRVEVKNVNRILASTLRDAALGRPKVDVISDHARESGLPTRVKAIHDVLESAGAVSALASCDVIFGCVDTNQGRETLNRICVHYLIPYFDVGVRLQADGIGGVSVVCGSIHYLTPDGPSLLDRGAITAKTLEAESLLKNAPEQYAQQVKEGYIKGVRVESPAVISVNGMIASAGVCEFLNRLHPFRDGNNDGPSWQIIDLEAGYMGFQDLPSAVSHVRWLGIGDRNPLLNNPRISL